MYRYFKVKELNIDDFKVIVKENKDKERKAIISYGKLDPTRRTVRVCDKFLCIDTLNNQVSVPITSLASVFREIGIGKEIWEELDKYYKE
jgi:hypothetical protein